MTGEKLDTGKLTDAQLAVLSRAARRRDGALTQPAIARPHSRACAGRSARRARCAAASRLDLPHRQGLSLSHRGLSHEPA